MPSCRGRRVAASCSARTIPGVDGRVDRARRGPTTWSAVSRAPPVGPRVVLVPHVVVIVRLIGVAVFPSPVRIRRAVALLVLSDRMQRAAYVVLTGDFGNLCGQSVGPLCHRTVRRTARFLGVRCGFEVLDGNSGSVQGVPDSVDRFVDVVPRVLEPVTGCRLV